MDSRPHLLHNLLLPSRFLHRYQVILLGDRGTRLWTTCLRLLYQQCLNGHRTRDLSIASPMLYLTVSNRLAGIISSRFPGDIFTKIQQNLQFYRHLPGRVTNPWDHSDPVYPSNSSVTDSPNMVYCKMFYWYTVKYQNVESARKFPGDFANFQ